MYSMCASLCRYFIHTWIRIQMYMLPPKDPCFRKITCHRGGFHRKHESWSLLFLSIYAIFLGHVDNVKSNATDLSYTTERTQQFVSSVGIRATHPDTHSMEALTRLFGGCAPAPRPCIWSHKKANHSPLPVQTLGISDLYLHEPTACNAVLVHVNAIFHVTTRPAYDLGYCPRLRRPRAAKNFMGSPIYI